jgi:ABC-type branched-subunit amino acid transport system ATPase component
MEATEAMLETDNLVAGYGDVNILHGVSIVVPPNSFVSVIGPNGAGKSTLLKTIYGIVPPRGGSVTLGSRHHRESPASPHGPRDELRASG